MDDCQDIVLTYSVKEIFYTFQGEGARSGRPAVFCRFSGCNLWSGREADRSRSVCRFCDTDFVGTDGVNGGKFAQAEDLSSFIESLWPAGIMENRYVVFTGGEPLLQLDAALIDAMHGKGFEIAIETNGTDLAVAGGDELKVVVPQPGQNLADYEGLAFTHFYVQPMDGENRLQNVKIAIDTCLQNPKWKLSLQTHKYLQIP